MHDELAYIFGGETFAEGRLTTPTYPLWRFFETYYINIQPTYASKYPPAQSLFLALRIGLFGHPWYGVLISAALMCGCICWMLRCFKPNSRPLASSRRKSPEFRPPVTTRISRIHELVAWAPGHRGKILQIPRVRQLVEVDDLERRIRRARRTKQESMNPAPPVTMIFMESPLYVDATRFSGAGWAFVQLISLRRFTDRLFERLRTTQCRLR